MTLEQIRAAAQMGEPMQLPPCEQIELLRATADDLRRQLQAERMKVMRLQKLLNCRISTETPDSSNS